MSKPLVKKAIIEEGEFKPQIGGTDTEGTATYSIQSGHYRKIGNIVFYDFQMACTKLTGSSGMLFIYGIPYKDFQSGIAIGNLIVNGSVFDKTKYYQTRGFRKGLIIDEGVAMATLQNKNWNDVQYIYGTGFYII